MRKAIIASLGGIALTMGLAACSSESEAPVEAAPEAPEGISVTDGRMNLPAVAGNPAAVYFTITNESGADMMLRAVSVQGAQTAMFHETSEWNGQMDMQELLQVTVPAGESVVFEQGGKHVMVGGLAEGLEPGGEVEVTLTFVRGDKISFPARVLAPGDTGAGN